jgi:hypothetical protein
VFERFALQNGTRVLTAAMPQAQSVTCVVMFAAGSRYETPETNGIAHFAEHMFFKGTESRPTARAIAGEIDGIGGEFNAFTGKEATGYYVKCAAGTRDTALDVLADMLQRSKFDADEIEREKGVIVEEMNMYFDTPRSYIGSVYERLLYGDQPLGWDIIGRKETVTGASRDTFVSYPRAPMITCAWSDCFVCTATEAPLAGIATGSGTPVVAGSILPNSSSSRASRPSPSSSSIRSGSASPTRPPTPTIIREGLYHWSV